MPRHNMPDLSHTVIDSETGEVLHQGLEGEEKEKWRKIREPDWQRFYEERAREREARAREALDREASEETLGEEAGTS